MKKTMLLVGLVAAALLVGSHVLPFSFRGPAMSCITAANSKENYKRASEFAASHDYRLSEVSAYLANSDFMVRNISIVGGVVSVVFQQNLGSGGCFLLDLISIDDGHLIIVDLSTDSESSHRIQRVRSNYGG